MTENEFRTIFDTIPEAFDRYRTRYCPELFADLLGRSGVTPHSFVLELGPGTGQATEPLLDAKCDYTGIELGNNFVRMLKKKYGKRTNFHLIHDDFITHDFGGRHHPVDPGGNRVRKDFRAAEPRRDARHAPDAPGLSNAEPRAV